LCIESIEFERILSSLAAAGADVVIIGGVAVILNGGDHSTQDVDFAFVRRRENARTIASALAPFNPRPVDFPEDLPFVWDEQTILSSTTLTLTTDLGRIDFLAEPPGAPPYPELKQRSNSFELAGGRLYVACIDDLISMKRAAGRPKDFAHISELESIKRIIGDDSSS
jgi:hypothetical protein